MGKKLPEELVKRMFENMYVCRRCNAKLKAQLSVIKTGKAKCRKCGSKQLRLKAKEKRGAK
jgi:ribosomal protein L40E